MREIRVTRSSMPEFEEYVNEIKDMWDSHWLTNRGEKHKRLEDLMSEYLKAPHISLFTNGHLALENALATFELEGEVITTPFTYASTTHAIVRNGLTPVFCDIEPESFTMDPEKIESLITEKTSAIVPVHVYGHVCHMDKIQAIADKYNLKVIYDAAHAFGVEVNGVGIANFGDASMFSFHATKVFHTIEGGGVTFRDEKNRIMAEQLKSFGFSGRETCEYAGGNAKMNEFQAAMGICNLRHIDSEIIKRQKIAAIYKERLAGIKGLKMSPDQSGIKSNYAYFPLVFEGEEWNRQEVMMFLAKHNIFVSKYFSPLVSDLQVYKHNQSEDTPVARHIASNVVTLPMFTSLNKEEAHYICDLIQSLASSQVGNKKESVKAD